MTEIEVTREAMGRLLAEAGLAMPREACGLLLGCSGRIDEVRPARNVHSAPATRFEIDPRALIDAYRAERAGGHQVLGYYHSHPRGPAMPSAVDGEQASGDGKVWAIVGGGDVRFWRDDEEGFVELSTRPASG